LVASSTNALASMIVEYSIDDWCQTTYKRYASR